MQTTTNTEAPTFYVTAKGSHRHADWICANQRRSILTGPVSPATADDADLPLCEHCNDAETVAAVNAPIAAAAAARAAAQCAGSGQVVPDANGKHLKPRGTCPECGKNVAASRGGRRAANHTPA